MSKDKVLITGAAGLIGARLVRHLSSRGFSIVSVDHREHFRSRKEHTDIDFGQIVDRDSLFQWLLDGRGAEDLRGIYHLGACTDTTQLDVEFLERVNLEYSKRLWNYASEKKVPLVYASSAATYGDGEKGYGDDESRLTDLKPLNPYGDSKHQFDIWALQKEKEGTAPPTWSAFKFFNVYGFGERHKLKMSSVVLQAFDQIQERGGMRLFKSHREGIADGHQKRDFIYVDDVVQVLEFAWQKPIARGIFNLGTGQARTFLDLAKSVFKAMGKKENIEFIDTPEILRPRYQYFTEATMERLREEGYDRHFTSLEDGVHKYVEELHRNHSHA